MDEKKRKFMKEVILLIIIHVVVVVVGIVYALFWMGIIRDYLITYFQIEQREITPTIRIMGIILNISTCITSFCVLFSLSYINFKYPAKIIFKEN